LVSVIKKTSKWQQLALQVEQVTVGSGRFVTSMFMQTPPSYKKTPARRGTSQHHELTASRIF
jgi:hypothetical protein